MPDGRPLRFWSDGLRIGRAWCAPRSVVVPLQKQDSATGAMLEAVVPGCCRVTLYADASVHLAGRRLRLLWAGNGREGCSLDTEIPADVQAADWSVVLPWDVSRLQVDIQPAAAGRGRAVLVLESAPWPEQLRLVLTRALARSPRFVQNCVRPLWRWILRQAPRRKLRPLRASELLRVPAQDAAGMRRHWSASTRRPVLRVWIDARQASAAALEKTLRSLRTPIVPSLSVGLIGSADLSAGTTELRAPTLAQALQMPGADWQGVVTAGAVLYPAAGYWLWDALQASTAISTSDECFAADWPDHAGLALHGDFDPELYRERGRLPGLCLLQADTLAASLEAAGAEASWPQVVAHALTRTPESAITHVAEVLVGWPGREPVPGLSADLWPILQRTVGESWAVQEFQPGRYRLRPPLPPHLPLVSVVIPTRDRLDLLKVCVESLRSITDYPALELIIADNDSVAEETHAYFAALQAEGVVRVVACPGPFNFSRINNQAVAQSRGELVLLLNNDIEVIHADWLRAMVAHALRPEIGCVGAKLLYPDGRLQHAGVTVGLGGLAGHPLRFSADAQQGYGYRLACVRRYCAVTAACLLVRRSVYDAVGGLDAETLAVAYNDVDFCLRVEATGVHNLYLPQAELVHHESVSRGQDDTPEKALRYAAECAYMRQRWGTHLQTDRYYPRRLTRADESCALTTSSWSRRPWLLDECQADTPPHHDVRS